MSRRIAVLNPLQVPSDAFVSRSLMRHKCIWIHRATHVCQNLTICGASWKPLRQWTNTISQSNDVSNFVSRELPAALLSPRFTVLLYRNVGDANAPKALAKSPVVLAVAAFLPRTKELTKHDNHDGHKSHNWCGRSGRARKPLRVEIHGTEQILFWQPSDVESTVEHNPSSGLSAYCGITKELCAPAIAVARELSEAPGGNLGYCRSKRVRGGAIIMKVFASPQGVSRGWDRSEGAAKWTR